MTLRREHPSSPRVVCFLACLASTASVRAQGPEATKAGVLPPVEVEVPAVSAELVWIDAVVTEKGGHTTAGLAREDFAVFEDGTPQKLVQFEAFARESPSATPAAPPLPPAAAVAAEAPRRPLPRHVVLMIDDVHMEFGSLGRAKKALTRFLDEQVDPEDWVALVTTSAADAHPEFTTDRAALRQVLSKLAPREMRPENLWAPHITEYQAELIARGDTEALEIAVEEIEYERGHPPDPEIPEREAKRKARGVLEQAVYSARLTLETVDSLIRSLARVPGRKVLFLLSDGFIAGLTAGSPLSFDVRRITDAGTKAGVVVYALETRGLTAQSPGGSAESPGMNLSRSLSSVFSMQRRSEEATRDAMNALAADTGGFLFNDSNDLRAGLSQMLHETDSYYLLAYEPTNRKRDGAFRRIEVRLPGRRGVTVRARRGYFAPDERRERAALGATVRPTTNPVRLSADFVSLDGGVTEVVVSGHVDVTMLPFARTQDRYQAALEMVATIFDERGAVVTTLAPERTAIDLTEAEHAQIVESGLQYQKMTPVKPGRYRVRLVAGGAAGRLGGVEQWVDVPDLASGRLTLSSVFLLKASQTPAAPTSSADTLELRNAQALRRFRRDEDLYVQLYAYNPTRDVAGATSLVSQAEVLKGGVVLGTAAPEPMAVADSLAPPVPHASRIKLRRFEPGEYELRVTVTDRNANESATGQLSFTID
jgi:VWFA-related protein